MELSSDKIQQLKSLYSSNKVVRAILDFFRDRERGPRNGVTTLQNIRSGLVSRGYHFQIEELQSAFEDLQSINFGIFKSGRRPNDGYFTWVSSAREIAQQIVKETNNAKKLEHELPSSASSANVPMETYHFPLRPGINLPIYIRSDMTADELMTLANFVKIIAASRGSSAAKQEIFT